MRVPRRAAVALSAVALTGALAACAGEPQLPAVDPDPGVEEPGATDPDELVEPDAPAAPGEEDAAD